MAKAILTIEDTPHGTVTVTCEWIPEIVLKEPLTGAQQTALDLLQDIRDGERLHGKIGDERD